MTVTVARFTAGDLMTAMRLSGTEMLRIIDQEGRAEVAEWFPRESLAAKILPESSDFLFLWKSLMRSLGASDSLEGIFLPRHLRWGSSDLEVAVLYEPRARLQHDGRNVTTRMVEIRLD
ncbi:hypothetical protein ACEUZ9_001070 [Paracoccus litorisediminis]|uniref:hypothetical protein n=1 Tax=Paracoccus litorisediminis TaxID=2006130 RepID=UPI0037313A34